MFGITRAPEINRAGLVWFNTSAPLSLADLAGRMVLLDFWTCGCINCIQTHPTLQILEELFHPKLLVIGIHSPKFAAEQTNQTIGQALIRFGITHPVIQDPGMLLWQDYAIKAWPTLVFLSPGGRIIGDLPGEPDPEALCLGIKGMLHKFEGLGKLTQAAWPSPEHVATGQTRLRYPGKVKPCHRENGEKNWAVADSGHHQVVVFDDRGREATRYGCGRPGFVDGDASETAFSSPQGLCGNGAFIWVADTGNHAVRQIDRASGRTTTLAGTGTRGLALRKSAVAAGTPLASPWDVERVGLSLFIANAGTHQILRWDSPDGTIVPAVGNGRESMVDGPAGAACLAQPSGLAIDDAGNALYFVDAETSSIRNLSLSPDGAVATLAGKGLFAFGHRNGSLSEALLQHPLGLTVWGTRIVVADSYNNVLRLLDPEKGRIEDLDLGTCLDSSYRPLNEPAGVTHDGAHRILVSDTNNHRIVDVDLAGQCWRTWGD